MPISPIFQYLISINLKKKTSYLRSIVSYQKNHKVKGKVIGVRCKPQPEGRPGYFRVDIAHQEGQERQKGVYYINKVYEVIQWEVIGATEKITNEYFLPLLEKVRTIYL
jgi:hypothetical protein